MSALIILLACGSVVWGKDKKAKSETAPESLTVSVPLRLVAFSVDSLPQSDTVKFARGDSIFIFDGQLFYRARANGREFFVSQNQLLNKSDSLVIYQNYRLLKQSADYNGADDTLSQRIVRTRCTAINQDGTRCKRLALPGKTKCWQHIQQDKSSK